MTVGALIDKKITSRSNKSVKTLTNIIKFDYVFIKNCAALFTESALEAVKRLLL